ncbi:MAG: hypothetical protein BIFFINMI_03498 [Phycisphaerae bacterium]|nr:hypothetical protein [Phycisphaerae bacterium]
MPGILPRTLPWCLSGLMLAAAAPALAAAETPVSPPTSQPDTTDVRTQLLQTVGSLAAANLYQSYLTLGMLADASEEDLYTVKEVQDLLAVIDPLLKTGRNRMAAVGRLPGLDDDDHKAVAQIVGLYDLLIRQSQQLATCLKSGKQDDADRFEATRQQAWKGVAALLGVPE